MSSSPRTLAEAWRYQSSIPRCSSFSEGTNKILENRITKSSSVEDNTDRLTSIFHLLSSLDSLGSNKYSWSLPNLELLKTPDTVADSPINSPIRTVDPNFDINTFLSKLELLDSELISPHHPLIPYTVAQPSLEVEDPNSTLTLSEEEPEEPVDTQIAEGTTQSVSQETSGSNTPPEELEDDNLEEGEEVDHPQEFNNPHIEMAHQLQIVNEFIRNPIDTPALRRYAFPGNRLSSMMITRFIDIPYFNVAENDTTVTRGIVLNMYAKGRCTLERWSSTTSQRTIAALEAIAPNLPNACFAARDDARLYLALATMHYISRNGSTSNYHRREDWPEVQINRAVRDAQALNTILERFIAANIEGLSDNFNRSARTIFGIPAGEELITSGLVTAIMAEACSRFLESLASEPTPSALSLSTEIYCLTYISIAKQGNITEAKLNSIE